MEKIVEYLFRPDKSGVHFDQVLIEFSNIKNLIHEIIRKEARIELKSLEFVDMGRRQFVRNTIDDLKKIINYLADSLKVPPYDVLSVGDLGFAMNMLPAKDWSGPRFWVRCFEPYQAILESKDAIRMDFSFTAKALVLNLFSVKPEVLKTYEEFIRSIPLIGKGAEIVHKGHRFSYRYCYEPYPSALMVWIYTIANETIPIDILKYFNEVVVYWQREEWRICIVLCAIAVESILAELYEEYLHETAPPDSLGVLFGKVHKIVKLPQDIIEDINTVNKARITSVHRSSMQLGQREARDALISATRFTHWLYFEGPLKN
jgi:HEPN domain-containing protein